MEYADLTRLCFRCGYCKFSADYGEFNCPSYLKFGFDTYAPGGRMWLIKAWLTRQIDISANYMKILYTCATCGNCKEQCVMDLKTNLLDLFEAAKSELVEEGAVPPAVRDYFKAISINGNPYKEPQSERGKWAEGIGIEVFDGHEYLFYVGDVGSYDERGKKMATSVASVFVDAGLSIGMLGEEEISDGNDVKALGEKWLFQYLAEENIKLFNARGVKKIITLDPHAYNAFRVEYPKFGGNFEVQHYTQLFLTLIKNKAIHPESSDLKVTYHDPCYLGRHGGVYDAPREILKCVPGLHFSEMGRNGKNALCCGGGGGNFFTDMMGGGEESPARIRVREALETGCQGLVVACPLCAKMLEDAVKAEGVETRIRIQDLAETLKGGVER